MNDPLVCNKEITHARRGAASVYLTPGVSLDEVLDALAETGEVLKDSHRGRVRRVGNCVIKESTRGSADAIKHTMHRARYRQAWLAAHHLQENGVGIAAPIAFVEFRRAGIISGHAMLSAYLPEHRDVEQFTVALIKRGAGRDTLAHFLDALANAINALTDSGAIHEDLSGKNILTADGEAFRFIDLDAVTIGAPYTDELRLKNHVQLYDSFCDVLSDRLLVPFLEKLLSTTIDSRTWMPQVREAQEQRRRITEERWEREGKTRERNTHLRVD